MSEFEPLHIDPAELAGVDAQTYAAADSGDRQAQKLMLRNLLTSEASATALTSGHWTDWTLRSIASGEKQAIADMLGSMAEAARAGLISTEQKGALDEMVEQFFGPGEVGPTTAARARTAFAGQPRESQVLELYLLGDRLASGLTATLAELRAAVSVAEALDSAGATAFFMAVTAQNSYSTDPVGAAQMAVDALGIFVDLRAEDAAYAGKVGMTALLGSQLADLAGDPQSSMILRAAYFDDIEAFQSGAYE